MALDKTGTITEGKPGAGGRGRPGGDARRRGRAARWPPSLAGALRPPGLAARSRRRLAAAAALRRRPTSRRCPAAASQGRIDGEPLRARQPPPDRGARPVQRRRSRPRCARTKRQGRTVTLLADDARRARRCSRWPTPSSRVRAPGRRRTAGAGRDAGDADRRQRGHRAAPSPRRPASTRCAATCCRRTSWPPSASCSAATAPTGDDRRRHQRRAGAGAGRHRLRDGRGRHRHRDGSGRRGRS